jgi:predicted flap endonuclease-1-like 5' DNA nuclease
LSALESVRGQNAELKAEIVAKQARLDALEPLQTEVQGLREKLESAQSELHELRPLRAEAQQLRDTVDSLQESLARAQAGTSLATEAAKAAPEPAPASSPPESQGAPGAEELHARVTQIAERTSGGEPTADDDLKQIRGVGPVIEKMLKAMGITSYRQIANFTKADMDQVTAAMGAFRGRMQRDGWIEGAREEYRKKYGTDA